MFGRLSLAFLPVMGWVLISNVVPAGLGGAEDIAVATCSRDQDSPAAAVGMARIWFADGAAVHGVAVTRKRKH